MYTGSIILIGVGGICGRMRVGVLFDEYLLNGEAVSFALLVGDFKTSMEYVGFKILSLCVEDLRLYDIISAYLRLQ